jgi:hypothetical protein
MHRTTSARSHCGCRTSTWRARRLRTRTLKDGASTLRSSRSNRRCSVGRPRSGLWHDHTARRRTRRSCSRLHGLCGRRLCLGRSLRSSSRNRSISYWSSHGRCGSGCHSSRLRRNGHWSRRLHWDWSSSSWSGNHDRTISRRLWLRGCRGRNRRPSDHWSDGRTACNSRRWWRNHNICLLARKRDDAARRRWNRLDRSGCSGRSGSCNGSRRNRARGCGWRRCNHSRRTNGWCSLDGSFGLLALEDRLQRIARLRDLRQIKLRLSLNRLTASATASSTVLEIFPDLLGLVGFNRTGVGLSGHANRFERVQNWPALYFQFTCQIIDSNFAHPSLFASLRP